MLSLDNKASNKVPPEYLTKIAIVPITQLDRKFKGRNSIFAVSSPFILFKSKAKHSKSKMNYTK